MDRTPESLKQVLIYTDGACSPNPGPGGYAAILLHGGHHREISGGFRRTTNNRMELFGAIAGLERLKFRCFVRLHSDSKYVVESMNRRWVQRWQSQGWRNGADRAPVPNADLWKRLLELCVKHRVEFVWVRGHAGDPGNEKADRLAGQAAQRPGLPADAGYEMAPQAWAAYGPEP